MASVSSSSPYSPSIGCSEPVQSTSGSTPEAFPDFLEYISGEEADDFRSLFRNRIVKADGEVTEKYAAIPLPPLLEEELRLIQTDYNTPFTWSFGNGRSMNLTFWSLMRDLSRTIANVEPIRIHSSITLSPYTTDLLFTQTNYPERVYAWLGIKHLYVKRVSTTPQVSPHQIVRTQFDCTSGMEGFKYRVALTLLQLYKESQPTSMTRVQEEAILQEIRQAIENFPTKITPKTVYIFFPFKGPVQWMACSKLPRNHLLSTDAFYIPVDTLFGESLSGMPVSPLSHGKDPMRIFFLYWLKLLKAEKRHEIDETGWGYYVAERIAGFDQAEEGLGKELIQKANLWTLKKEIKKWADKYPSEDHLFAFILTTYLLAQDSFPSEELYDFLLISLQTYAKEVKNPLFKQLFLLLVDKKIPPDVLFSFLQFSGFLQEMQKGVVSEGVTFQIGTDAFERPVLKCCFGTHTIPLPLNPRAALERLLHFQAQEPDKWEAVEGYLTALFLQIYTPAEEGALAKESLSKTLFYEELDHLALSCLENASPLVTYLGVCWILSSPLFSRRRQVEVAETHFHKLLPILCYKESQRAQFLHLMGIQSLPNAASSDFLFNWIRLLFQKGGNSDSSAYTLWQKLEKEECFLSFSSDLILFLAPFKTEYALRIFSYLKSHHLQRDCNLAVKMILRTKTVLQKRELFLTQKRLASEMGLTLLGLIQNPAFQPWNNKKTFTNCIEWYGYRLREMHQEKAADQLFSYCAEKGLIFFKQEEEELPPLLPPSSPEISSSSPVVTAILPSPSLEEAPSVIEEKPIDPLHPLMEIRNDPSPTDAEIKAAIALYNQGVSQKKFSKEESVEHLCFLIQKASPEQVYTPPKITKGRRPRQPKNQAQGKGLLANLITLLSTETLQTLKDETRDNIRFALTQRLLGLPLSKGDKLRVAMLLTHVAPLKGDLSSRITFIKFCNTHEFALSQEVKPFWLNTVKEWYAQRKVGETAEIQALFKKGREWGFDDPELSKQLDEVSKDAVREALTSDLKKLSQQDEWEIEEVQMALEKCRQGIAKHLFSSEEEIYFLSSLLRMAPHTSWVLEALLQRVYETTHLTHLNSAHPEQLLSSLLQALESTSIKNKTLKKGISLLFRHLLPYATTLREKQALVLYCTKKNLVLEYSQSADELWRETLKTWYATTPQDFHTIYACCLHGKTLGFDQPSLRYSIVLSLFKEALSKRLPIKEEWIDAIGEGFPQFISLDDLDSTLTPFFCSKEGDVRKKVHCLERLALKNKEFPDYYICAIVESLVMDQEDEYQFLAQWFIKTTLFDQSPERNGLKMALEIFLDKCVWIPGDQLITPEAVAITIKYFADLDRMSSEFWQKCFLEDFVCQKKLDGNKVGKRSKETMVGWFDRLAESGRLTTPSILQKLYTHTFYAFRETGDRRLLDFLNSYAQYAPIFAPTEGETHPFFSCYQLIKGCSPLIKQDLVREGLTSKIRRQIAQLFDVQDQMVSIFLTAQEKGEDPELKLWDFYTLIAECDLNILQLLFASQDTEFVAKGYELLERFASSSARGRFSLMALQKPTRDSTLLCDAAWLLVESLALSNNFVCNREFISFLNRLNTFSLVSFKVNFASIYKVMNEHLSIATITSIMRLWRSYFLIELHRYTQKNSAPENAFLERSWHLLSQSIPWTLKQRETFCFSELIESLKLFVSCFPKSNPPDLVLFAYISTVFALSKVMQESDVPFLQEVIKLCFDFWNLSNEGIPLIAKMDRVLLSLSRLNYDAFHDQANAYFILLLKKDLVGFNDFTKNLAATFLEILIQDLDLAHPYRDRMLNFISLRILQFRAHNPDDHTHLEGLYVVKRDLIEKHTQGKE